MASVIIDSGPVEATHRPDEVPKEKWRMLMRAKQSFINTNFVYDCRCLLDFVKDAELMWEEIGFESVNDMIENGYDLDPEEVEMALIWLNKRSPTDAVRYSVAIEGGRIQQRKESERKVQQAIDSNHDATQEQIAEITGLTQPRVCQIINELLTKKTPKLNNHGGLRDGQGSSDNLAKGRGKPYTIARLKRDGHVELANDVESGKMSARQAALQVGYIKERTPFQHILTHLKKLDRHEIIDLAGRVDLILRTK